MLKLICRFYRSINLKETVFWSSINWDRNFGGIVIRESKKIPKVGQIVYHNNYKFIIEIVDKKKLNK